MIKGNVMSLIEDSSSNNFGGDTGIDADFVPTITVVEDGENMFLELMAEELGLEKLCEMTYEEGNEPEIYA
jgi:hypothetical protein